jgi:RNA-directed DNA polymerase
VDLEKFFDRVNHDVLMGRLEKRIGDRRLLRVIRRYLEAGIMADGVVVERHEGTPQGGPLSPLLANVLLDEVDRSWSGAGTRSCATPTTATCTCGRSGRASG